MLEALGGAIVGGMFNASNQTSANETNIRLARENREWQENMANTEVQRRKRDLIAAGLNPILAAGSSASTPTPTTPQVEAVQPRFVERMLEFKQAQEQIENTRLNNAKVAADTANTQASTTATLAGLSKLSSEIQYLNAQTAESSERTKKTRRERTEMFDIDVLMRKAITAANYADAKFKGSSAKDVEVRRLLNEYQLPGARTEAEIDSSKFGRSLRWVVS